MISQQAYSAFRDSALKNQPLRKTIQMADLKFITMDSVEYAGLKLGISRGALKNLLQVIGLSAASMTSLEKTLGEEGSQKFLNGIKNLISAAKSADITIVVSPDRIITQITKGSSSSLISAETYFDTFERIANTHKLDIKTMEFNKSNGNIYMNTILEGHQHQVGSLSDEVFHTGLSLARTADGIQADPYMDRLVCTNGMVNRMFEESFALRNMDPRSWETFYKELQRNSETGFVPKVFNARVMEAIQTPASLAELNRGAQLLLDNSKMEERDLEMFFSGYKNTYGRLHAAGIDTEKLSPEQRKNVRTGVSVWDVINGITDFASHNYGFEKKENSDRHMQMVAGDILGKKSFDSGNLIMNQPF